MNLAERTKMRIKKYILAVGCTLFAGTLLADAMYWMVDESKNDGVDFTYAQLKASKDGKSHFLPIFVSTPSESSDMILADGVPDEKQTGRSVGNGDGVWADLGEYKDGWSYSIVLWGLDDSSNPVGQSDPTSFEELIKASAVTHMSDDGVTPVYASSPWSPVVYAVDVPEPTSGLLALFGAAMLALRRKRCSLKL